MKSTMNKDLRWRVMLLQVVVVAALAFCTGFLYWGANFTHGYVRDELAAQQIAFPWLDSPAITPREFPDLQQYAGQAVDDGDNAKASANGFINRHLAAIGGGKTYSQISAAAQQAPTDPKLAGLSQTLFHGETLRGLLLNA